MMYFQQGDRVEVASKEDGFVGSYYKATIVAPISRHNQYVVEYKTLVEDHDMSTPLREVADATEVRPRPPVLYKAKFRLGDRVDAFDNDGWWVGTVSGADLNEEKYYVYFEIFGVEIGYDAKKLRVHQDWNNGRWKNMSALST
ncbi:protein AGENET DOMAIN (AGD)-CONTAINING P1-like [Henckelia pumila]|uniref:protein AGENET DOMAIN (AGD)-CONTAINING P1-like n=1 Tax=Henckelia pumila TaxID=405737 RepID=UPI003C6DE10F